MMRANFIEVDVCKFLLKETVYEGVKDYEMCVSEFRQLVNCEHL